MKPLPLIIILALVAVGAAVAYVTFNPPRVTPVGNGAEANGAARDDHDGHDHAAHGDDDGGEHAAHGSMPSIEPGAKVCATHHVPDAIDPFCNPKYIEEYGWCAGHNVAEALCTRCNGVLIPAFKAEGDWCAEHGLPESQCAVCNPETVDS